jgi:hypothetical protein
VYSRVKNIRSRNFSKASRDNPLQLLALEDQMPDTVPNIRVVPLDAVLAEVSRHPRPFVVINRARHTEGRFAIPGAILQHLPDDFSGDLMVVPTTLPELNKVCLPLGRHRDQFVAGEPVMIAVTKLHETPDRPPGGQEVVGLKERVRDGLYITVTMATERMRACSDYSERRKMKAQTRRLEILERLAPHLPPNLSSENVFDAGQRLVPKWYPGPTAYQTMKLVYLSVMDQLAAGTAARAEEAKQIDLVSTATAVYTKTDAFLTVQHEMSAKLRELMAGDQFKNATAAAQHDMQARLLREQAPALHQEMAHDKQGGPSLPQLMQVAAAMDFNPSWVFANVLAYECELDCAMLLGRSERGVGAMLQRNHIVRLKRFMTRADEVGGHDAATDTEVEAARHVRDLALRVRTPGGWDAFFAIAERDGREFWVTRAL